MSSSGLTRFFLREFLLSESVFGGDVRHDSGCVARIVLVLSLGVCRIPAVLPFVCRRIPREPILVFPEHEIEEILGFRLCRVRPLQKLKSTSILSRIFFASVLKSLRAS
jgi:hypothetical protein